MKKILNLDSIKRLSKQEQQTINGGTSKHACFSNNGCYSVSDCLSFLGNCKFQCFVGPDLDEPGICVGIPL